MRGSAHVVLVGDHCQLPPVVVSPQAAQKGLTLSLFERMMQAGVPSGMLQVGPRLIEAHRLQLYLIHTQAQSQAQSQA